MTKAAAFFAAAFVYDYALTLNNWMTNIKN